MTHADRFSNLDRSLKIGIIENMYIIHTPQWFEERTKFKYTIWNIAKGRVYISIDGKKYTVSAGDVVLFAPGTTCIAHTDKDGCEFMFEQFSIELGNSMNLLNGINLSGIIDKKYIGKACIDFCKKMNNGTYFVSDFSLRAHAEFFSYLVHIIELVEDEKLLSFGDSSEDSVVSGMWEVMSYISEHFLEEFSVKDFAKKYGLSEKYFITNFRSKLGITPKQYLIQCRMRYASHMLVHSEEKIQDIASYMGYSDVYSFSKAFKQYCGESPAAFRRFHKP